jgi:hypothetical protein
MRLSDRLAPLGIRLGPNQPLPDSEFPHKKKSLLLTLAKHLSRSFRLQDEIA